MFVIIGLVILVAAVIAGVAGVLTNSGGAHAVGHFAVFGYHVTGSTGTLFLYGMVVGAVILAGLSMLLAGARRTSRRGREARNGLKASRRETAAVSQDRDDLIEQRETARAYSSGNLGPNGSPGNGSDLTRRGPSMVDRIRGRIASSREAVPQPRAAVTQTGQPVATPGAPVPADPPVAEVPVGASASAE
jgi:gas vesicle protein